MEDNGQSLARTTVSFGARLLLYRCLVMSTLTSGLTALALSPTETAQLDRFHLQKLSVLLHGEAAYYTSNWVLQRLHIPSIASFLCAQRIRWLQRIIGQPDAHMLLLAVVTGRSRISHGDALDASYQITQHASPWLRQWWRDLQEVAKVAFLSIKTSSDLAGLPYSARTSSR
eukprot:7156634-Heterocapsa_arctica.AAC.1